MSAATQASTDGLAAVTVKAKALGVVFDSEVNAAVAENNELIKQAGALFREGGISIEQYTAFVDALVAEENALIDSSREVVTTQTELTTSFRTATDAARNQTSAISLLAAATDVLTQAEQRRLNIGDQAAARRAPKPGIGGTQAALFPGISGGTFTTIGGSRVNSAGQIVPR